MHERIVCTVITVNYLAFARTLAYTLKKYNPNYWLYVLIVDANKSSFDSTSELFEPIFLEDLSDQKLIKQMCFYYTPFELCCALRAWLHEFIYRNKISNTWIFLDADIAIYNSLDLVFNELEHASILLNPHLTKPVESSCLENLEVSILVSGIYNAGFLGLKRSEETQKFIKWFKARLANYCFNRRGETLSNLLFVDQLWLNFVPHFFDDVAFLKHPGVNAAYWNLAFKKINKKNDIYLVDNEPIIFVHFTGWNFSHPSRLSVHLSTDKTPTGWSEIGEEYQQLLLKFGYEEFKKFHYGFASFENGRTVTPEARYYYFMDAKANSEFEPFSNFAIFPSKVTSIKQDSVFRKFIKVLLSFLTRT